MKNLILAGVCAASMVFGLSGAEAKSSVHIYFGVPHYGYAVDPDYIYRSGYGWYDPDYAYDDEEDEGYGYYDHPYGERYRDQYARNRLSCGEARRKVRNQGYRDVRTVECNGITFTFRAWRNGRPHQILVNSRTGAVWRG